MSMSSGVFGVIVNDNPIYLKHKKIWEMCKDEGVSLPKETEAFFTINIGYGDELVKNPEQSLERNIKEKEWSDDWRSGIEILVKDIPEGVEKIRFYNCW